MSTTATTQDKSLYERRQEMLAQLEKDKKTAVNTKKKLTEEEHAQAHAEHIEELRSQSTSWEPASAKYLCSVASGDIKPPEATIWQRDDGAFLIYPGRTHLFLGEPESCKTWVALEVIAQEIKAGFAAIYIDLEDAAVTAVERLLQLGLTVDEIAEGFLCVNPAEVFDAVAWQHLQDRIQVSQREVSVAIIDSMTEVMSLQDLDPDRGTDVTQFYHQLPSRLTEDGLAVVIIDHVVKSGKGGKWAIGSERKISGLTGAAYGFKASKPFGRGMTGHITVTVSKDRPGAVRPLSGMGASLGMIMLASDPETGEVSVSFGGGVLDVGAMATQAKEDQASMRQEVWNKVDEEPGIGWTELRDAVEGDRNHKGLTRDWLLEQEYIRVEVGAHNKKCHYIIKPLDLA